MITFFILVALFLGYGFFSRRKSYLPESISNPIQELIRNTINETFQNDICKSVSIHPVGSLYDDTEFIVGKNGKFGYLVTAELSTGSSSDEHTVLIEELTPDKASQVAMSVIEYIKQGGELLVDF